MRKLWMVGGWIIVAAVVYFSLFRLALDTDMQGGDKLGHFLAYGGLMLWWSQLCVSTPTRLKLALAFVALGGAMELAQGLTPGRYPEWIDLAADTAGVLAGWLAAPPRLPNFYQRLTAAFPGKLR
ncbi:MAG: VanZ family protein [Pseudomonadota bacterium]